MKYSCSRKVWKMQGVLKVKRPTRLKMVSNENCGWSGRWQMLGSGLRLRRSLFNCHLNMPFWIEKSISGCICNSNKNSFLANRHNGGHCMVRPASPFSIYFSHFLQFMWIRWDPRQKWYAALWLQGTLGTEVTSPQGVRKRHIIVLNARSSKWIKLRAPFS
jgi:hypothetical protein